MFEEIEFIKDANLADYSTMKIGGQAKRILFPKNLKELRLSIKNSFFILGNGSNVLFLDEGYDKDIICLKNFDKIKIKDNIVTVEAGVSLFKLNLLLCEKCLSGLEWSFGIPASFGGFVFMNGGSFGHEICEFIDEVKILNLASQKVEVLKRNQINFQYRNSNLQNCIILSAKLILNFEKREEIAKRMREYILRKKQTQPYDLPSLGSIFKIVQNKGETIYPAKLIDKLGLKGVKIGGAQISEKHAGFIVNQGGATAKDVLALIALIEKKLSEIGVDVEKEIIVCR